MTGVLNLLMGTVRSAVVTDPYFEYTTLLLPGNGTNGAQNNTFLDGSTNNFPITRNPLTGPNAPTQGTFSPFSQTGWGGYFDGNGDYLTLSNSSNFSCSGDFTVDFFIYPTSFSTTPVIFDTRTSSGNTASIHAYINTSGNIVVVAGGGSIISSSTYAANSWYYVAIVRSSNVITLYVNAASAGTNTISANLTDTGMTIGAPIDQRGATTTNKFTGYISNFRFNNTTARTISSTPTTALTADFGTTLLTLQSNRFVDNASSATITPNGNTSIVAFSPFNPTASWSAATYGGSGYFDGSGDWLEVADNTALNLSGGVWTIEAWTYLTADYSNYRSIINKRQNGSSNAAYQLGTNITTGTLIFFNGTLFNTGVVLTRNTWNHVAAVYDGTNINVYLNGSRVLQSATGNTNYAANVRVGAFDSSEYWGGYITNVRILKGTAQYTGATYTVPTAPLTAITNTSLLLNFTNAGIYDATSKNDLETVGNAQISTAISAKWGSGSMYFNGTTSYLNLPDGPLFTLGSENFTIESWIYTNSSGQQNIVFLSGAASTYGLRFEINGGGTRPLQVLASTSGSSWAVNYTAGNSVPLNTWTHVALVRSGTNIYMFQDGTQVGVTQTLSGSIADGALNYVGMVGSSNFFSGYIQDLRITKGYARYTSNFTAPTAAFPTL